MESREFGSHALLFVVTVIAAVVIVRVMDYAFATSTSDRKTSDPDYGEVGVIHIRPPKGTLLEVEVVGTFETATASGNLSVVLLPGPGDDKWKVWTSETVSKLIDAGGSRIVFRVSGDSGSRKTTAIFYPKAGSTADSTKITISPKSGSAPPRPYLATWSAVPPVDYKLHLQVEEFDLELPLQNSL